MQQNINRSARIESDAVIILDVSALDSIYPKPVKVSDLSKTAI